MTAGGTQPEVSARYADGSYAAATETWHDQDAEFKARWIADLLRAKGVRPELVCDVGCGTGGVLDALRVELPGTRMIGFEPASDAVNLARDLHPDVEVRLGSPQDIKERADVALLIDVFEHVEDYLGFLRDVRPAGRQFIFHIPLELSVNWVLREEPIVRSRSVVGHLHYFTKATAMATLEDAGYRVDATVYTPGSIALPNRPWRSRALNWPRRMLYRWLPDLTVRVFGGYSLLVLATPTGTKPGSPDNSGPHQVAS